jgi:ABC-type sugar transport system substrate-binding protein
MNVPGGSGRTQLARRDEAVRGTLRHVSVLAVVGALSLVACSAGTPTAAPTKLATQAPAVTQAPVVTQAPAATPAPVAGKWWEFKVDTSAPKWGIGTATPSRAFKIGIAHVSLADQYYVAMNYGIEEEAKANGLTISKIVAAGGYDHLADQVKQIEDMTASDVDVILTLAASEQGTKDVIDRAVAAGKVVITMASVTASDNVYAQIAEEYAYAGEQQAQYLCAHLAAGAKVAMLAGPTGASWSGLMNDGFTKEMAAKCPGVVIVDSQNAPVDPSKAQKLTEDWLQRFPDLAGIYSVADAYAQGAVPAIEAQQKSAQITITTQGFTPWSKQALLDKKISMAAANAPIILGRWAVQAAIHAINGEPGPGRDTQLSTPMPPVTTETVGTAAEVPEAGAFTPDGYTVKQ